MIDRSDRFASRVDQTEQKQSSSSSRGTRRSSCRRDSTETNASGDVLAVSSSSSSSSTSMKRHAPMEEDASMSTTRTGRKNFNNHAVSVLMRCRFLRRRWKTISRTPIYPTSAYRASRISRCVFLSHTHSLSLSLSSSPIIRCSCRLLLTTSSTHA